MRPSANYIPPEQFNKIIESIPQLNLRKSNKEDVEMFFKICYWCLLRPGETLRLVVEDIYLQDLEVFLGKTKMGKNEVQPIPPEFAAELKLYLDGKHGPLFPTFKYITIIKWMERIGKILDIPAWTTSQNESGEKTKGHIFRKSMAKDLEYGTYRDKAPISLISKALRHKGKNPIASTYHYLKLDTQDVKEYWKPSKSESDQIKL